MPGPFLYIFAGLPGSGKSTIARMFCQETNAVYLRIDTLEQGLRDLYFYEVEGEGYRLAYLLAADNLRIGNSVVADSCNPIALTRKEWGDVASNYHVHAVNIEVICSNQLEHQRRIADREADIKGLTLPSWEQVQAREYHPWTSERIIIDTANKSPQMSIDTLVQTLTAKGLA